ncbi:phenolpthiocerol synthesis polyketide synthase ppsA [Delitschia confertaspora ATCC 74209]|uniref:Phenolpthiocerol synthesis polyketide synthase ppsA n=1 Tax=Delitschia confertaspora ATCC 74209 TaxID=1513339 RepID=A0A9P4JNC3_9PLEO|nr:phenolpthiocerol synthesis polyketide synthase ppsA [Delitschia confertaspora ATCC 74209]
MTSPSISSDKTMPIAIVGMGCRFPGSATNPSALWDMLVSKQSARSTTPADRFNIDAFNHPNADRNGTASNPNMNNRGGHFLKDDISAFDAPFFSISPAEAQSMDPMQRHLLEVVYEATESAGIPITSLSGTETGCFVGCFTSDYDQLSKRDPELLPKYHSIGTGQSILSNRISFCFDLRGPSVTLDTACSSSLVALHLACQSLRAGESKTAIVGATNAILSPDIQIGMTNLHFLSPDSTCHTFSADANGYARGEGMAALVLKPLVDAIRDGDTIRSVIRGTAVNSDGKTPGITLPSKEAQIALIRSAYEQAGCDPAETGYFEAHGTGTAAGDPIETGAVGEALGPYRAEGEKGKLYIGSIKTNIGHLEGASGLAGLIKAVLSVERGIIAPNLWYDKEHGNPEIDFDAWRIRVPTEVTPWPVQGVRRASVNSFGYGGTNGHVIIDDTYHYLRTDALEMASSRGNSRSTSRTRLSIASSTRGLRARIFHLSAKEEKSVKNMAATYAEHLKSRTVDNEDEFLDDLAYTFCERRSLLPYGTSVVATSLKELIEKLTDVPVLVDHPTFSESLASCDKVLRNLGSTWSVLDELLKDQRESRINEAAISQPLCTAIQIALIDMYATWNIHPARVVGHSSGEIAAAYATGALTVESAMKVAYFRGLLSSNAKNSGVKGAMMAAGLSEQDAEKEIAALGDGSGKAVVACVNSPGSVTLSGDLSAINQLQKSLTSQGKFARKLQVDTAYHSHHMLAIAKEYRQKMGDLEVIPTEKRNQVEMYSSVTGRPVTEADLTADYWVRNMVSCVRFSDALQQLCEPAAEGAAPVNVLVELGPHSALAGPVKQVLKALSKPPVTPITYQSALIRGKDASVSSLEVAASLFAQGYPVDTATAQFSTVCKKDLSVLADLPSYAWNHERKYWAESRLSRDYRFRPFPRTDILGAPFHDWNPIEPRWRNFIRISEQPWVKSHVVQGAILYPAAGFCCMALQAAWQMSVINGKQDGIAEYKLRDVAISRALVVPETEEGVEVIFSMRPQPTNSVTSSDTWNEFRVFSYTTQGGWDEHCRGLVSTVYKSASDGPFASKAMDTVRKQIRKRRDEAKKASVSVMESIQLYKDLDAAGLSYGPEFQGIVSISAGENHATGTVQVTDTRSTMPKEFEFERLVHPATMDSLLQMSICALSRGDIRNIKHPYVPTFIQEVAVSGAISASIGKSYEVAADARLHGFREAYANVVALEQDTLEAAVRIDGIKCMAISSSTISATDASSTDIAKHCVTAVWEPDVDLLSRDNMTNILREPLNASPSRLAEFELLAWYYTDKALKEVKEEECEIMLSHHQKFFRYMQHQRDMVLSNTHEQQTEEWTRLEEPNTAAKIQCLIDEFSLGNHEERMFTRMGEAIPSVLRQEIEPLALMMKDNLLYDYYTVGLGTPLTYPQVAQYVAMLSHKYPNLDYLEIGAGTGGLTVPVLGALSGYKEHVYPRLKSYTYTDISTGFFEQAAEKFSEWAGLMEFKKLDIEQDPDNQGFEDKRFDVILAANVLHATFDIDTTIRHARKLLRPGGKLILLDMTHSLLSVSLIFGNLPGWWNCSEPWRQYGPLLDENQWRDVLQRHGFSDLQASTPDYLNPLEEGTRVMIASAVEEDTPVQTQPAHKRTVLLHRHDLTAASKEFMKAAKTMLDNSGVPTEVLGLSELQTWDLKGTVFISFLEWEHPLLTEISPSDFSWLQRLMQQAAGLFWLTRGGAKGSRPQLSLFQGLARSLRAEQEGFPCITVDFDSEHILPAAQSAELVMSVYKQTLQTPKTQRVVDREFSEQGGVLRVKRAIEDDMSNRLIAARTQDIPLPDNLQDIRQSDRPLKLKVKNLGSLDSFIWTDDMTMHEPLPTDHVEIEVHAVGLNFRDVLISMGEISDNYLGNECAGIITKVGKDVPHLLVGDRVAAWCLGSFSTRMRNPAHCVQRIPDDMSFSTAAALPLVYVTAYYSLITIARLEEGESILIHAAAGGVGQAAIQIAKTVGAEIFVTVGTEKKKQHLMETYGIDESHIFSSRDLSFVQGIRSATSGRGVDVVLNSLAGDALQTTWKCIAPFGRFVEIGKRDIDVNSRLEMSPFARNVTFSSVDVTVIFRQNKKLAQNIFRKVMELVRKGEVKEASPLVVDAKPHAPLALSGDASYLLAGGLGGLGRSMSRWMAKHGAKHLIFVSRNGPSSAEASEFLKELDAKRVRYAVLRCDITQEEELCTALSTTLKTFPPIRGVIQGAMVLKDQIFANMTYETYINTLRPKVHGSWSLHKATLDQPLDFFLLLSSAAGFVGNAGQGNYVAGCTYQDALSAYRNSLGLPATSIDIGKVTGVGFVAENAGTVSDTNLKKLGMLEIQEAELLAMLELSMKPRDQEGAIKNGHMITGVHSTVDLTVEGAELPFWGRDPVFSHMSFARPHLTTSSSNTSNLQSASATAQPLPVLLASSKSPEEASGYVMEAFKSKLSRSLMMSVEDLDPTRPTSAYGVDSLIAVEIRNWFIREVGVDVPVFEILQASSLTALVERGVGKMGLKG